MRYGSNVHNKHTLFPLGINAVELAPQGHVELVVGHTYASESGLATAGRVLLSPAEAIALAEELHSMVDTDNRIRH